MPENKDFLISVVCPVFNTAPDLLVAALESVLEQDRIGDLEVIVVDDASTSKDTLECLCHFSSCDSRVHVLRSNTNSGPSSARKMGVEAAKGEWICFLDSDDLWPRGSLAYRKELIRSCSHGDWVGGDFAILDASGRLVPNEMGAPACTDSKVLTLEGDEFTKWLIANTRFHLGGHCFKKESLGRISAFAESLHYGEDWLLFVKLSTVAACHYSPRFTYVLRRQHGSMMTSPRRATMQYAKSIYFALRCDALYRFRRELRWALYSRLKGIALDNARRGQWSDALAFGLRAYILDPREISDLTVLLKILTARDPKTRDKLSRDYSCADLS